MSNAGPSTNALPYPIDQQVVSDLAASVELSIPTACMTGVIANLRLLADHAARLDDAGPA